MQKSTKVGAGALAALAAVGPLAAPGVAGAATTARSAATARAEVRTISRNLTCSGSKFVYNGGVPGNITFDFNATISGTLNSSNSAATFTRINYSFSNVKWTGEIGWPVKSGSAGSKSNVNVKWPRAWNSPDSLGGSGTVFPSPFTVSKGGGVGIEGVPDIKDLPDPSCTATATIDWTNPK